ncbi:flagellin [Brevundimonas sp. NPDC092305]|jgi:flagellin|uniref:flagellin n=1 Tax=Brevundimonas sp. NPDC092305 TaxID=3363957 RepID=UPI0037FFB770
MASINTNYGAMVAAQSFAATGRELDKVQNRVTTGLKISSAKDNGAVWAIATTQRANSKALDAKINTLQRDQSIADVKLAAGETIMAALTEMKSLAAAIEAGGTTTAYQSDYTALSTEITSAIAAGVFDGSTAMTAPATALAAAGSATAANVQAVIDGWAGILQGVGTSAKSYERQLAFTSKLQDALEAGAGNLVDADLAKESARLTALQTKQQLGVQALSIANSASSTLLGLFR